MRFKRDVVHPAIFAATDRFTNTTAWTSGNSGNPAVSRAAMEHQHIWFREYGPGCGALLGGLFVSIAATEAIKNAMHWKTGIPEVVVLIAFAILTVVLYQRHMRQLTSTELKALLPALELTDIQRAYAEALLAASALKLGEVQFREVVAELNRLLDDEARLLALKEQRSATSPAEIDAERQAIRAKLEASTDTVTREALARSLELADARFAAAEDLSHVDSRVDAQLDMVLQATRSVRDSLGRINQLPNASTPALNIEALRRSVDQAQSQSQALERAVEEVRTL